MVEKYQTITIKGEEISEPLIIALALLLIVCVGLVIIFSIRIHRDKVRFSPYKSIKN